MASTTAKPVHSLVLDAGPIIKNDPAVSSLISQAEQLYTIPAVIQEIRDAATRSRVETTLLPFLVQRTPKPESMKVLADFARRTGDLEVLSKTDIQLMALSYELEVERNGGDWRLRSMPGQKQINGAPPSAEKDAEQKVEEPKPVETEKVQSTPTAAPTETRGAWGTTIPAAAEVAVVEKSEPPVAELAATHISEPEAVSEAEPAPALAVEEETPLEEDDDDDEGGWITPANIKKHQAADALDGTTAAAPTTMQVATITSDFAMQNVMLRMNLNLLSPQLSQIRTLKTWILRCHACFATTKDMTKQFCGRCGKPTLLRTSCSVDKNGEVKIHLKKNMQWNTRGDKFSIPKPVAGSTNGKRSEGGGKGGWGMGLVLAEDQKEYEREKLNQTRRRERDLMDEDYLPNILTGDRKGANGRIKVGAGRNVNSKKRR